MDRRNKRASIPALYRALEAPREEDAYDTDHSLCENLQDDYCLEISSTAPVKIIVGAIAYKIKVPPGSTIIVKPPKMARVGAKKRAMHEEELDRDIDAYFEETKREVDAEHVQMSP